jgi:hypothetical protein
MSSADRPGSFRRRPLVPHPQLQDARPVMAACGWVPRHFQLIRVPLLATLGIRRRRRLQPVGDVGSERTVVLAPGQPRVSQARHSAFARTICCDHPYFGAKLDAYALVSFLLGQTERIAGLVTVTNLPSRPAPVLARTITSLSTHGRHPGRRGAGPLGHRDRPSRPRRDRQVAVFSGRSLRWQDAAVRELPPHLARHARE